MGAVSVKICQLERSLIDEGRGWTRVMWLGSEERRMVFHKEWLCMCSVLSVSMRTLSLVRQCNLLDGILFTIAFWSQTKARCSCIGFRSQSTNKQVGTDIFHIVAGYLGHRLQGICQ